MPLKLQANAYARPDSAAAGPAVTLRGLELPTLRGGAGGPPIFTATMPRTFEEVQAQLMLQMRCDCEPDGFFLMTGGKGGGPIEEGGFWRLNGHMHEFEGRMHRVELNGECPPEGFDRVLTALGWPEAELVFELVQEGVTLAEGDFRRWAAA